MLSETGIPEVRAEANRRIYRLRPEPFQLLDAWGRSFRRVMGDRFDNLDASLRELRKKD